MTDPQLIVTSALALVDSLEHRFGLVVGKLCRHYAPLPLVPPPTARLPDRTATCPRQGCRANQPPRGPHNSDIAVERHRTSSNGITHGVSCSVEDKFR